MEDMLAGSSETLDNNINQVLAKVSPSLLRRRSPSPNPQSQKRESLNSSGGGATSSSCSSGKKSESSLSPPRHDGTSWEQDGKSCKSSSDNSSSDTTKVDGCASSTGLSKSPSSGSVSSKSKNKIPNQAKKKSWYSVFYPSYKSRSADFKKLFKDVPDEERLLVGECNTIENLITYTGEECGASGDLIDCFNLSNRSSSTFT